MESNLVTLREKQKEISNARLIELAKTVPVDMSKFIDRLKGREFTDLKPTPEWYDRSYDL